MVADIDDFAGGALRGQQRLGRQAGMAAVVDQIGGGAHALAPLVERLTLIDHDAPPALMGWRGAARLKAEGSSSSASLSSATGSTSRRFMPTRLPVSKNSTP